MGLQKKIKEKPESFYGLVLTGGKSSRMKDNKAALEYEGRPQAQRCFDLLSKYCDKVFISTRKEHAGLPYQNDLPQIHDHPEFSGAGPLAGILSAMTEYPEVSWIIFACDLPFVDTVTLEHLIFKRQNTKYATAYRSSHDGLPEPLCAVYEPQYRKQLFASFKKRIYCPRKIMINSDVLLLEQAEPDSLDNVNTPEEYRNALAVIMKRNELRR